MMKSHDRFFPTRVRLWKAAWSVLLAVGIAATWPNSSQADDAIVQSGFLRKSAAETSTRSSSETATTSVESLGSGWIGNPKNLVGSFQAVAVLSVLSLAPAIVLMTTSYVRIIVVLGLLKSALGTPQLPPQQVVTSIALFMTMFIMAPVWNRVYEEAIVPYTEPNSTMTWEEAWEIGIEPIREFMAKQIHIAGNYEDVHLFRRYSHRDAAPPSTFSDVPIRVLLPAYMLSELKTAFIMGFQIFLPFLILDIVVAAVTVSMGMVMLPPATISLPFKLLLFVLLDGWRMVVQMLLESFGVLT